MVMQQNIARHQKMLLLPYFSVNGGIKGDLGLSYLPYGVGS